MSDCGGILENMFDNPGPEALAAADDAVVVGAIGDWERGASAAEARRLAAIGELVARRCSADDDDPDVVDQRLRWACDPWDATAAEVAAALGISARRASSQMYLAQSLRERLPGVNALFLAGRIGARLVSTISWRTHCVIGAAEMAAIDEDIAKAAEQWGPLSDHRIETLIDAAVDAHDPHAREWFSQAARGMDVQFGKPDDQGGTRSVWGRLYATHAELIERRLTAIARAVCDADPRTVGQRRAEAMGAVFAGADRIACQCGLPDCPNPTSAPLKESVVIHVVADKRAVDQARAGASAGSDAQTTDGDRGQAENPRPAADQGSTAPQRRSAALMTSGGVIPNPLLAHLIRAGAKVRHLRTPSDEPEPGYRPSTALDEFVRFRDLTCRFPNCDVPAEFCDIDHTIPWPLGPTHPSNLSCKCRKHHLLKTFWEGWTDRQYPDGTIIWTAPTGHTYTTYPGARMHFPDCDVSTGVLTPVAVGVRPPANRSLQMPRRRRTRAADRAQRIKNRRARNDSS